jgi:hypothetical protein
MSRIPTLAGSLSLLEDQLVVATSPTSPTIQIPRSLLKSWHADWERDRLIAEGDQCSIELQSLVGGFDGRFAPVGLLQASTQEHQATIQLDGYGLRLLFDWAKSPVL